MFKKDCLQALLRIGYAYPGSWMLILEPGSNIIKRIRGRKNKFSYLFCSYKFPKNKNYYIFKTGTEKGLRQSN